VGKVFLDDEIMEELHRDLLSDSPNDREIDNNHFDGPCQEK
jgi:hypothetical protein